MKDNVQDVFEVEFDLASTHFTGTATPMPNGIMNNGIAARFAILLKDAGGFHMERDLKDLWHTDAEEEVAQNLVDAVGHSIFADYQLHQS